MYQLFISILSFNIAYCIVQPICYFNQIAKRDVTGSYMAPCIYSISECNCGLSCSSSTCQCNFGYYWTGSSCGNFF